MAAGWSKLGGELLVLILEKLDLADHARFASVCSTWRSFAVENPPTNKPLYFVLSHGPEHLIRRFFTSFVPLWEEVRFIGALDGWMVIVIDYKDLFLLNKGLNSMIPLPPPPKDPNDFFGREYLCKAVLSSPPSSSSSGECTVVIRNYYGGLFYSRLGTDESFTEISESLLSLRDFQFYKGRLYVLNYPDTIIIFDHLLNKVTEFDVNSDDSTLFPSRGLVRLLISENRLLFIGDILLSVYEFELGESRISLVKNMNDNLLLLINCFCPLSITAKEHKEFRRTSYYFKGDFISTIVLDTSEDPNNAKLDDPWPLFFFMFNHYGIRSCGVERTIM